MQESTRLYSGASPEQVAADLAPLVDFQDKALSLDALDRLLRTRLIPHLMRYGRPEFQSMFNAFLEEGAELGARLALAYNQGVTNWQVSPGGAMLEELCCQALCRLFGLAPTADATFMLAGTYANEQAIYMALHRRAEREGFDFAHEGLLGFRDPGRLVAAVSRDAHFSLKHAVRTVGLGEQCLVTLDVDEDRRIDVAPMEDTLAELSRTRDVFCVVATAGTTPTGAVDPLLPMADMCKKIGAWFHVDGAYGLAYSLVPEWKPLFAGVELADSVSWDPHKQLRVPIPSSVMFTRRRKDFARMALFADYFNREGDVEPNPGLKSTPSTRPFAALPLVASLRHQGMEKVQARLRAPLVAIRTLAEIIQSQPGLELAHQPDTGILCFRVTPPGVSEERLNELQRSVYERIMSEGNRSISMTRLDGKAVLRLVAISPAVTAEALMETLAAIRTLAREVLKGVSHEDLDHQSEQRP
jgi:glutamate/tyrosine decarboxylase-like PLP-dependent enzyme